MRELHRSRRNPNLTRESRLWTETQEMHNMKTEVDLKLRFLDEIAQEFQKMLEEYNDGGPKRDFFNFENQSTVLQDDWSLGERSGKFAGFQQLETEIHQIIGRLYLRVKNNVRDLGGRR